MRVLLVCAAVAVSAQKNADREANCTTTEAVDCVRRCESCLDVDGRPVLNQTCTICLPCLKYGPCIVNRTGSAEPVKAGNVKADPLGTSTGNLVLVVLWVLLLALLSVGGWYVRAGYQFLCAAGARRPAEPAPSKLSPLNRERAKVAQRQRTLEEPLVAPPSPGEWDRMQSTLPLGRRVSLTFEGIKYWVPHGDSRRLILDDVSLFLSSGCFTAIMGPSGSGKTTLLNLLSGRARAGEFTGTRRINGARKGMEDYNAALRSEGYVLQEDMFFEELTVRQSLTLTTALKLRNASADDVRRRTERLLDDCKLRTCADTRIGCAGGGRGISGGQRRRLSIAEQLAPKPDLLLLDEPTSGLDATSSLKLCQLLRHFAVDNRHVVCTTIHQPRPEIMALFTHLLLLNENGRIAFFGPAEEAVPFLVSAGVGRMGPADNPGDFIIDALALDAERLDEDDTAAQEQSKTQTRNLPDAYRQSTVYAKMQDELHDLSVPHTPAPTGQLFATSKNEQMVLLTARRIARMILADLRGSVVTQVTVLGVGAVLSVAFAMSGDTEPGIVYCQVAFLSMAVSFLCVEQYLISIPDLFVERRILIKERASGDCRLSSYLLSVLLWETPRAVLHALMIMACAYANPRLCMDGALEKANFFFMCLCLGLVSWHGVVVFFSFLSDTESLVWAMIFLVMSVGTLYSGLVVSYEATPYPFIPFYYTSVPAYIFRALIARNADGNPALEMDCEDFARSAMVLRADLVPGAEVADAPAAGYCSVEATETAFLLFKSMYGSTEEQTTINAGLPMLAVFGFHDAWTFMNLLLAVAIGAALRYATYHLYRWRDRKANRLRELVCSDAGDDDVEMRAVEEDVSEGEGGGRAGSQSSCKELEAPSQQPAAAKQYAEAKQRQVSISSDRGQRVLRPAPNGTDRRVTGRAPSGPPERKLHHSRRGGDAVAMEALNEILGEEEQRVDGDDEEGGNSLGPLFCAAAVAAAEPDDGPTPDSGSSSGRHRGS